MSRVGEFQQRVAAATGISENREMQTPRWFVGERDHTWSWNRDGRMEAKCRVVVDVANQKLVAAQVWGHQSWADAGSDQYDDLARSLFVENKVSVNPRAADLIEIDRLPTWVARAVGDQQLPPYQDDEVIGLDNDGCVVQWNSDNDMPVNSGESLDAFGLHNLREHEIARIGVAREAWLAAVAEQGEALEEPAVAPVVARFRADGDFNAANQRMRKVIEQQAPEVCAALQEAYAGLLEAAEGVRDQYQADWRAASAQPQHELHGKMPEDGPKGVSKTADALEACDWSGVPIGNKAVIALAVQELRNPALTGQLEAGLKMRFADGSVQDTLIVWEGGNDVAICKELDGATRVAKALRLAGSSVENIWVTKGSEFETVYDDPKPQAKSPSPRT